MENAPREGERWRRGVQWERLHAKGREEGWVTDARHRLTASCRWLREVPPCSGVRRLLWSPPPRTCVLPQWLRPPALLPICAPQRAEVLHRRVFWARGVVQCVGWRMCVEGGRTGGRDRCTGWYEGGGQSVAGRVRGMAGRCGGGAAGCRGGV